MKFNNFAYIFLGPELNSKQDFSVVKTEKLTFTAIGIDFHYKEQVIDVAKEAIAKRYIYLNISLKLCRRRESRNLI